jgi:hypothetical protein
MAKGLAGLGRYLTVNGCCPHHGTETTATRSVDANASGVRGWLLPNDNRLILAVLGGGHKLRRRSLV